MAEDDKTQKGAPKGRSEKAPEARAEEPPRNVYLRWLGPTELYRDEDLVLADTDEHPVWQKYGEPIGVPADRAKELQAMPNCEWEVTKAEDGVLDSHYRPVTGPDIKPEAEVPTSRTAVRVSFNEGEVRDVPRRVAERLVEEGRASIIQDREAEAKGGTS